MPALFPCFPARALTLFTLAGCGSTLPDLPDLDDVAPVADAGSTPGDAGVPRDAAVRDALVPPPPPLDAGWVLPPLDAGWPIDGGFGGLLDGTVVPVPIDAGRDAGWDAAFVADAEVSCSTGARCVFRMPVDVSTSTPIGSMRVTSLSVEYLVGQTYASVFTYAGLVAGQPFAFRITLSSFQPSWPAVGVGQYATTENDLSLRTSSGACITDTGFSTVVNIREHTVSSGLPAGGDAIALHGTVLIVGAGWSITLPLDATSTCGTNIAL